ncbi:lycopene cyclase family protein [Algoriphagus namhaensis]|uniref:Lycopene cyclase family protein n=1 Tax=Algoriphagus namhaensis TaxID=915353 RepID=A0ABV8ASK0_9BACT
MKDFDYIIAGAGCAGMSLMFQFLNSSLKHKKILLIDPTFSNPKPKTWCYWNTQPLNIHPPGAEKSWSKFTLQGKDEKLNLGFDDLRYYHINSFDFFDWMEKTISLHPNVSKLEDNVVQISESWSNAKVTTATGQVYTADWVFDSRLNSDTDFDPNTLKQIFSGWRVEMDKPVFDSEAMTFMDFSGSNSNAFEFIYVLPFSEKSALVEFTTYTKGGVSLQTLDKELQKYLAKKFPNVAYQVSYREDGVIPMTTKLKKSSSNGHIIPIGTRAGWTKASTGYTFHTIQKHCEQIVSDIEQGIHPLSKVRKSTRFSFYDNILLNIASKQPARLQEVFMDMFRSVKVSKILKFLSEETAFQEEVSLLSKLKFGVFIESLMSYEKH